MRTDKKVNLFGWGGVGVAGNGISDEMMTGARRRRPAVVGVGASVQDRVGVGEEMSFWVRWSVRTRTVFLVVALGCLSNK